MKHISYLILAFASLFIMSCEGDQGPPGPSGGLLVSSAFEIEIDFNAGIIIQILKLMDLMSIRLM